MRPVEALTLEFNGVRLEPLTREHDTALASAARDGELWRLRVTSVPAPGEETDYIDNALSMQQAGSRLPFAIRDLVSDTIVGSTSYHDIAPSIERVEIGYTWYSQSRQRSHVNTSCKLVLMRHAFDVLGAAVVGFRTDHFNFASQQAIARLGAKRDGVIRHSALRRDGSVRDTVMFSILRAEWPDVQAHLQSRLAQHGKAQAS